ncbi:MAG: YchF/TatD family DNA exonuclease [Candidatus Krumholzibacteriota bacterium]|nr:YchF/TatD family DNA exonuclease [Candidatus Krumholzibacteriota bacterium]
MLIDSHAHLNMQQFAGDLQEVMDRAREAGVGEILNIGFDPASIDETLELADRYGNVYAALGIHPHNAADWSDGLEDRLKRLLLRKKVVAVGEIGLDYYRDLSPRDVQQDILRRQIGLALRFSKPMIIHCRDAFDDLVRILDQEGASEAGGIFHAFSGGADEIKEVLRLGFLAGIGGPLTYKNSQLPEVVMRMPSTSFVLETDCPYLPPVPYRGKRNEPAYLRFVAEKFADLRGVSVEDVERAAEVNYRRLIHRERGLPASIAYSLGDRLYINVTSTCTNDCIFCSRSDPGNILYGYNLELPVDPKAAEMVSAAEAYLEKGKYSEIVFCGYGEPTARIRELKEAAGTLKKRGIPLRLNTNGQGNAINRRDIVPELEESFASLSISLNAPDRDTYMEICRPDAGKTAFDTVLDFTQRAAASKMETAVTVLDHPLVDIDAARKLVSGIKGARFRVRKYHFTRRAGRL